MQSRAEIRAFIGIGSNLGDRLSHIRNALLELEAAPECRVGRLSRWYRSAAVGPGTQGEYINGVIELWTSLSPFSLLDSLLSIEQRNGRVRGERWAARTLDLDILVYADCYLSDDRLQLPHPRMHERNFVVYPLYDLAPDLVLPGGIALGELRATLDATGLQLLEPEHRVLHA